MLTGETEQRLECRHRRASSVEPEYILVQIVGQVFSPDAMMGAQEPRLEIGECSVYSWKEFGRVLPGALRLRTVVIALSFQGNIGDIPRPDAVHGSWSRTVQEQVRTIPQAVTAVCRPRLERFRLDRNQIHFPHQTTYPTRAATYPASRQIAGNASSAGTPLVLPED